MLPLKLPPLAAQVTALVAPPVTFAVKLTGAGAIVLPLGWMPERLTLVGVALQVAVVEDVSPLPPAPVTVSVYVCAEVTAALVYVVPDTALAATSELPAPRVPITAVPALKTGTRLIVPPYPGAVELHESAATAVVVPLPGLFVVFTGVLETVNVTIALLTEPAASVATTYTVAPFIEASTADRMKVLSVAPATATPFKYHW